MTVDTACPAPQSPTEPAAACTAARLLTEGVLSTSSSSWGFGWLQESCAACQALPRHQGAGAAAAAEGGIRGTDVLLILCRTS